MNVVGLMTGTSADGLDVALVDLGLDADGDLTLRLVDHAEVAFDDALGDDLLALLEPTPVPLALVASVDRRLGVAAADAVEAILADHGLDDALVVSHGQTVQHLLDGDDVLATLQIGQPAWIAERTGCAVVSDVRSRDVAAGGQGAPLASLLDQLLLADADEPTAALNLGGIANITVVGPGREPIAYDTGPANALIDLVARRASGQARAIDRDGALAASGTVVPALLEDLLADPYYARSAPKSTGKEHFHAAYLDRALAAHPGSADRDVAATVTRLTALTVARECARHGVSRVVASGGGTRNGALMRELRDALGPDAHLVTLDEIGLPESAKEAVLMALIGWLTWHGAPATVPSCTGARHATLAGRLTPGREPLRLPPPLSRPPRRLRLTPDPTRLTAEGAL